MTDTGPMQVDTKLVRELAELLDATNLTEIEVQDGERRVRVARKAAAGPVYAGAPAAGPVYTTAPVATTLVAANLASSATTATTAEASPADDFRQHPGLVRSPIVGTAYLTPDPASPPYVTVGQTVKAGATLLIIEAMKVMNPITAPKAGTVTHVLISNEQPVEYDEPLIVIE